MKASDIVKVGSLLRIQRMSCNAVSLLCEVPASNVQIAILHGPIEQLAGTVSRPLKQLADLLMGVEVSGKNNDIH